MARTTRSTAKPSLMTRLRGRTAPRTRTTRSTRHGHGGTTTTTVTKTTKTTHHPTGTHATHATPATHHRRRPGLGDKISGALLKLKGSLTRRPGQKAAGTRRMHGTDGRGARTHRRHYDHGVIDTDTSAGVQTSVRAQSIAVADQALGTAIDLVAQVQFLQNRLVEVENLLASRDAEVKSLMEERSRWRPESGATEPYPGRAHTLPVQRSTTSFEPSVLKSSRAPTFASAPVRSITISGPATTQPVLTSASSSASSLSDIQAKNIERVDSVSGLQGTTSSVPTQAVTNGVASQPATVLDAAPNRTLANTSPPQSPLPATSDSFANNTDIVDTTSTGKGDALASTVAPVAVSDSIVPGDSISTPPGDPGNTVLGDSSNTALGDSSNIDTGSTGAKASEDSTIHENMATTPGAF